MLFGTPAGASKHTIYRVRKEETDRDERIEEEEEGESEKVSVKPNGRNRITIHVVNAKQNFCIAFPFWQPALAIAPSCPA